MKYITTFWLISSSIVVVFAKVPTPIELEASQSHYIISPHLEILEDAESRYDFAMVSAPPLTSQFVLSETEVPNFGLTQSTHWARFQLRNVTNENQSWILEFKAPLIDHLTLFSIDEAGQVKTIETGDRFPFAQRDIVHRTFAFNLHLAPFQQLVIYLKVKSGTNVVMPLTLWQPDAFVSSVGYENVFWGGYFGIMLVMSLYNLFIFLVIRQRVYVFYILYITMFGLLQFVATGFAYRYLWPNNPILNEYILLFLNPLALLFAALFIRDFLDTRRSMRLFDRVIDLVIIFSMVLMAMSMFIERKTFELAFQIISAATIFPAIGAGIWGWMNGIRTAKYFLLAWLALFVGIIFNTLRIIGVVPGEDFTRYSLQIGSALEAVLLSFALADRIKEAFDAQRASHEKLELMVDKRTAELSQAKAEAENASYSKSRFLASMSHELRTPLNAIIGYSELLAEDAEDNKQAQMVSDIEKVSMSARHLLSLIDEILDISKLEAGKIELFPESFNVADLLHEVAAAAEPLASKKHNKMVYVYDNEQLGEIMTDMTRCRQILFNLLSNAAKFTEHGEIRLQAERQHINDRDWLEFRVSDNGIGISEGKLEHIFESFTQADASTTRQYGGTGLGLAITRQFVELMGGNIAVESAIEQGSTFTVRLPAYLPH